MNLSDVAYADLIAEVKRRRKLAAAMLWGPDTFLMLIIFGVGYLVGYLST